METVRTIVEQIARGLRALHRQEMLHQDLRPDNILIDNTGTVKIIDFGSVRVAGIAENDGRHAQTILGTAQYTAPEYFLGEAGTTRSDLFSLGVITYQMLSGRLPYGTRVAQATTRAAQRKLAYEPVLDDNRTIPAWVDFALRKAVHPHPDQRYAEISEFIHDLRRPNRAFLGMSRPPLLERNPVLFWQGVSLLLFLIIVSLLGNATLPGP
jgi:serine/threonine protein kinase